MSTTLDGPASSDPGIATPGPVVRTDLLRLIMRVLPLHLKPRGQDIVEPLPAASMTPLDPAEAAEWVDRLTPELRRRIAETV